jgi:non-heme chloroperoxidase
MDTYADDLGQVMEALELKDAVLVGHSTGGGVVARYIGRHGTERVAKAVLIGSVTPLLLKTPENPNGAPIEVFDGFRQGILTNRAQFMKDLTLVYFGADRPGAKIPEALLTSSFNMQMMTGFARGLLRHQGVLRDQHDGRPKANRCSHADPAWRWGRDCPHG